MPGDVTVITLVIGRVRLHMRKKYPLLEIVLVSSILALSGCDPAVNGPDSSEPSASSTPAPSSTSSPTPTETGSVPVVSATAILSNSFDGAPNWQSDESFSPTRYASWPATWVDNPTGCTQPPPLGFTSYRAAIPYRNNGVHTFILSAEGARIPGGKGMTYNIETAAYGAWAGGGLDLYLGNTGYRELFVRVYLKYDPVTFHWGTVVPNFGIQKVGRISRLKCVPDSGATCNPQVFYSSSSVQAPTFYPDFMNNPAYNTPPAINATHLLPLIVYDPGAGDAVPYDQWQIPWPSDGRWHSYEFRVRMNSSPGAADGEWEVWIDGSGAADRHFLMRNVAWVGATGSTTPAWNWVTLLDNSTIQPDPAYANSVMKLFMDDVVLSTHYSGPPPSPTNLNVQSPSAGQVQLSWNAGSNGAQYLLSGYRIRYGISPDSLDSSLVLGSATAKTISGLTSGQRYYFRVTAANRATYDKDENESVPSETLSALVK